MSGTQNFYGPIHGEVNKDNNTKTKTKINTGNNFENITGDGNNSGKGVQIGPIEISGSSGEIGSTQSPTGSDGSSKNDLARATVETGVKAGVGALIRGLLGK